jgi:hypothetical protein
MNIRHMLVLVTLFLVGYFAGTALEFIFRLPRAVLALPTSAFCILAFAWPIYRFFGLRPQPPLCPNCGGYEYKGVDTVQGFRARCIKCGAEVLYAADRLNVIKDGATVSSYKLRRPKFLGLWRKEQHEAS